MFVNFSKLPLRHILVGNVVSYEEETENERLETGLWVHLVMLTLVFTISSYSNSMLQLIS